MPFLDFSQMPLKDFKRGIRSLARVGEQLSLAVIIMETSAKSPAAA
jgi:hypothetical protein